MSAQVRPATPQDADGIARTKVTVWREAYAGLMPQSLLDGLDVERTADSWRRYLTSPEVPLTVVVAEGDGEVVGFACAGPGRDDDRPVPLQLMAINLLRSWRGSGLAQQLLDAAVGSAPAYLWVADPNPRAQAFYSRNGFHRDGREQVDDQLGGIREVRMVRTPPADPDSPLTTA